MILSSEVTQNDVEQMLAFYKQHFMTVDLVSCSVCGARLAFECAGGDGMGMPANEIGKYIIPIGENLLSSRVRLDEAPTGERMMGYQCGAPVPNPAYPEAKKAYDWNIEQAQADWKKAVAQAKKAKQDPPEYQAPIQSLPPETIPCGNDTRVAEVELGQVPISNHQVSLSPFEKDRIRQKIRESKHKPDFRKVGDIKHFETFQVERIK